MSTTGPETLNLSSQEQQERFQITFTAIVGCLCLVASAALPLITFILLVMSVSAIMLSLRQWREAANLAALPSEPLDTPTKTILITAIVVLGIFFLQLNPFSQVIIATAFGTGLAAFFIHECILGSQDALNEALKTACQNAQLEQVQALLARGACVFAKDNAGNTAFHHAISNNAASVEILKLLQVAALRVAMTRQDVLESCKELVNDEVTQAWQRLYQQVKQCIQLNNRENRAHFYEAASLLINAYHEPLKKVITIFTQYLRDKLDSANTRDLRNNQGRRPIDLINASFNPIHQQAITRYLTSLEPQPATVIQQEQAQTQPATTSNPVTPLRPQPERRIRGRNNNPSNQGTKRSRRVRHR